MCCDRCCGIGWQIALVSEVNKCFPGMRSVSRAAVRLTVSPHHAGKTTLRWWQLVSRQLERTGVVDDAGVCQRAVARLPLNTRALPSLNK